MAKKISFWRKLKMIIGRMIAVFVANGLAVIGAGSIIGIDILTSVLLAGSLGCAKVLEALARGYIDDGKLDLEEINDAFSSIDRKMTK